MSEDMYVLEELQEIEAKAQVLHNMAMKLDSCSTSRGRYEEIIKRFKHVGAILDQTGNWMHDKLLED